MITAVEMYIPSLASVGTVGFSGGLLATNKLPYCISLT